MTHRGGLGLSIIIWRIGGGGRGKFPFALGPKNSLGGPGNGCNGGENSQHDVWIESSRLLIRSNKKEHL